MSGPGDGTTPPLPRLTSGDQRGRIMVESSRIRRSGALYDLKPMRFTSLPYRQFLMPAALVQRPNPVKVARASRAGPFQA
jgi:hypothetical protein